MEEINQEGTMEQGGFKGPNSDPENDDSGTISISKKKIYLAIGALLIAVIIGAVLFVAWDIYERNFMKKETLENVQEDNHQEGTPSDDPGSAGSEETGGEGKMFDLFSEKYIILNESGSESDQDSGGSSGKAEKTAEASIKWKTYINADIGYMLQYPEDWKVIGVEEYNETIQKNVKYIKIESPKSKYELLWGIKENADPFEISDRTGVGMGELASDEKVKILETEVETKKFVYEGKILEYLAEGISGSFKTKDGKHSCMAAFHPISDEYIGKSSSPNIPEVETAKEILGTIKLIPRSGEICQLALTEQDKDLIKGMDAFYNETYKYIVNISSDWERAYPEFEKINPDDIVTFVSKKDPNERFQIRTHKYAEFEIPSSWKEFSTKEISVTCSKMKSNVHYYQRNDMVFLVTYFSHKGLRNSITYGFKSPGASITGDVIELYEAIMKSIIFVE